MTMMGHGRVVGVCGGSAGGGGEKERRLRREEDGSTLQMYI
jgi:hypothetical protein